jgi:hypothetical protein
MLCFACLALPCITLPSLSSYAVIHPNRVIGSVSNPDQVVAQLLDRCGCLTRLDRLRVVCNEDGLFCFDNHDAFLALHVSSLISLYPVCSASAWLLEARRSERSRGSLLLTFFPYRLLSSAFSVTYFSPAMCKPVPQTFFGSAVSL